MSPTSRTLTRLRQRGYLSAVVERWLPGANVRSDLWRFGDVLAVHPGNRDFLIVQSTSASNVSSRRTKSIQQPELTLWLRAGGRFEIHGWGKKNGRWDVRIDEVTLSDAGLLAVVAVADLPRKRRRDRWQPIDLFDGLSDAESGDGNVC